MRVYFYRERPELESETAGEAVERNRLNLDYEKKAVPPVSSCVYSGYFF